MSEFTPILDNLTLESPIRFENLCLVSITTDDAEETVDYITLDEAITDGSIKITEVNESGNVPELLLENHSNKPVLIIDGEELVGAKQNRIVNLTILAPAHEKIIIPVSCVESGRWSYDRSDFVNSNRAHFAKGRAKKMMSVSQSMDAYGRKESNQSEVWDDISVKFSRMEQQSPTSAMSDMFEKTEQKLKRYLEAFEPAKNQIGAFFFVHSHLIGFDLFDKAATLKKLFPKLLRSYAIDAIEEPPHQSIKEINIQDAVSFVDILKQENWKPFKGTGLGTDYRYSDSIFTAAGLLHEGKCIHLSGFKIPNQDEPDKSRMATLRQRRRFHYE